MSKTESDTWAARRKFWDDYAKAFARSSQEDLLSRFVKARNVTGAFAEAWVRSWTRNMLSNHFRVSTGAVIRATDRVRSRGRLSLAQCDLIVWDPSEVPAIFEAGEFALVPNFAARAIIEVKRSGRKGALAADLTKRRNLLVGPYQDSLLGIFIRHAHPLFDDRYEPDTNWVEEHWQEKISEPPITRLFDAAGNPDTKGIMAFVYFLARVAGHRAGHSPTAAKR